MKGSEQDMERRTDEQQLARLSVLTELTTAALAVADPEAPVDRFLQRVAERLGCLAALLVEVRPREVRLSGAAGLSRASCAISLSATTAAPRVSVLDMAFPYPELDRDDLDRWVFEVADRGAGESTHLILFSPRKPPPDAAYRAIAERLAGQLGRALEHRRLFVDLRRSYADLARAQKALLAHERLAAVGQLAAVVAHEVRNPLGVIFNSLAALRKLITEGGPESTLVGIVAEEAGRLNRIIGDLLEFARPGSATLDLQVVGPVLGSAVEMARSSGAPREVRDVLLQVAPDLPELLLDARQLKQAVLNLVMNAVQVTPVGETVVVRAGAERRRGAEVVRIEVVDVGAGIPADVRGKIFDPFFTTKPTGTGLGLAVVKRVVDAHQGEVTFESSGEGTTFTIRLPVRSHDGVGSVPSVRDPTP